MTTVLASTEALPELVDVLARRHQLGLDGCDEWWEGVYRVVTGPSPEHGTIVLELGAFLLPLARAARRHVGAQANIGQDKVDCRVPDLAVWGPDTPRTSTAFLASADLVVEILSPGEQSGAKLDFYGRWRVAEYLEIDLHGRTLTLLCRTGEAWATSHRSDVLGFDVLPGGLRSATSAYRITWPD